MAASILVVGAIWLSSGRERESSPPPEREMAATPPEETSGLGHRAFPLHAPAVTVPDLARRLEALGIAVAYAPWANAKERGREPAVQGRLTIFAESDLRVGRLLALLHARGIAASIAAAIGPEQKTQEVLFLGAYAGPEGRLAHEASVGGEDEWPAAVREDLDNRRAAIERLLAELDPGSLAPAQVVATRERIVAIELEADRLARRLDDLHGSLWGSSPKHSRGSDLWPRVAAGEPLDEVFPPAASEKGE